MITPLLTIALLFMAFSEGTIYSDTAVDMTVTLDVGSSTTTLIIDSSEQDVWFAVGFGDTVMSGTNCISLEDNTDLSEWVLPNHKSPSDEITPTDWTLEFFDNSGSATFVVFTRDNNVGGGDQYTFNPNDAFIDVIWAHGSSGDAFMSYHSSNRIGATLWAQTTTSTSSTSTSTTTSTTTNSPTTASPTTESPTAEPTTLSPTTPTPTTAEPTTALPTISNNHTGVITFTGTISPEDANVPGILTYIFQSAVNVTHNSFDVVGVTQDGYDVLFKLNHKWGFNALSPSNLTVILDGVTYNENDGDLLMIFSVGDSQYLSTVIRIESGSQAHRIFPTDGQPLAVNANVTNMMFQTHNTRWDRISKNDSFGNTKPTYKTQAIWPLQFDLYNDPINNELLITFKHNNMEGIAWKTTFTSAFDGDKGIDLYIMADNEGESFGIYSAQFIYSFDSAFTYDPTKSPTKEPTVVPTVQPTNGPITTFDPTTDPTNDPTMDPTVLPSVFPTSDPTVNPTDGPTTNEPTDMPTPVPTVKPTKTPTNHPSSAPTDDTDSPTDAPTEDPTEPTVEPTGRPTRSPTRNPALPVTQEPTVFQKSSEPTTEIIFFDSSLRSTDTSGVGGGPPDDDYEDLQGNAAKQNSLELVTIIASIIGAVLCVAGLVLVSFFVSSQSDSRSKQKKQRGMRDGTSNYSLPGTNPKILNDPSNTTSGSGISGNKVTNPFMIDTKRDSDIDIASSADSLEDIDQEIELQESSSKDSQKRIVIMKNEDDNDDDSKEGELLTTGDSGDSGDDGKNLSPVNENVELAMQESTVQVIDMSGRNNMVIDDNDAEDGDLNNETGYYDVNNGGSDDDDVVQDSNVLNTMVINSSKLGTMISSLRSDKCDSNDSNDSNALLDIDENESNNPSVASQAVTEIIHDDDDDPNDAYVLDI